MKKFYLILLMGLLVTGILTAQEFKIAYIDTDRVLSNSNDGKQIKTVIATLEEEWDGQLIKKEEDLKLKYDEYQNLPPMTDENYRKQKETEISALEEEYLNLKKEISQKAQKKQDELLTPLFEKLGNVTQKIAQENGYTAIFDLSLSGFVYIDPALDITEQVLTEMNKTKP